MALDRTAHHAAAPETAAQCGDYAAALAAIGAQATGVSGYLAAHQFALIGAGSGPIIDGAGEACSEFDEIADDGVLAAVGLRLVHVPRAVGAAPLAASLAALEMRIGLLRQLLAVAYAHLKPRQSFGQKTLHHQLVKADFGDASGALILLKAKCEHRLRTGDFAGLAEDHAALSAIETQSEKLMGGHGYLIGGTHQISYVSMLVRCLYAEGA